MECFLRCAGLGLQLTALCLFNVLINRMANVLNAMGRLFSGVLMAKYQILQKTSSVVDLTLTWNIKEIKLKLQQELSNNLSSHNS